MHRTVVGSLLSWREGFRFWSECYVHGIMDGEAMDIVGKEAHEDFVLV